MKIPYLSCTSAENGRLNRLQTNFCYSSFFSCHSVFRRLPNYREVFWCILLRSSENSRFLRHCKSFAPKTGRLLRAREEPCFVKEKVYKIFENIMQHDIFFTLGICFGWITTLKLSYFQKSHSLEFISVKCASSTVFRKCILLTFFPTISAISTIFRVGILLVTNLFSSKSTIFRRLPLPRLQISKVALIVPWKFLKLWLISADMPANM